jgi:hypothetical protein
MRSAGSGLFSFNRKQKFRPAVVGPLFTRNNGFGRKLPMLVFRVVLCCWQDSEEPVSQFFCIGRSCDFCSFVQKPNVYSHELGHPGDTF